MNAMRKTGLHCAGLHSKSESQSFCCSTALQHQVLLKMSAMWKLEFSGLKCTLVQVKVKVFQQQTLKMSALWLLAIGVTPSEWHLFNGSDRIAQLLLRPLQLLLNYRFAHFDYCSTIAFVHFSYCSQAFSKWTSLFKTLMLSVTLVPNKNPGATSAFVFEALNCLQRWVPLIAKQILHECSIEV